MTGAELYERDRSITERIAAGASWKAIAREYGLSKSRLGQILRQQRGQVAPRHEPLSDEESMQVVLLALDGVCVNDIVKIVGRHHSSVRRALKANAVVPSRGDAANHSDKYPEAIRLVQLGHSYSDVGNILGISRNVVAGAIHRSKEKQRHDDVSKLPELQRRAGQGQPSGRGRERHPEKARL
jgi:transposase-like protein